MLADMGSPMVKKFATSNFAATTDTTIDLVNLPSAGQQLPTDFLYPIKCWEKLTTDPDQQYIEMDQTAERLPDNTQSDRIRFWMVQNTSTGPAIVTLGATTARTVRLEYFVEFPAFAGSGTEYLPVPGTKSLLAYDALKRAALARGEVGLAQYAEELRGQAYDRVKRMHISGNQRRPRTRRPFGRRRFF